MIETYTTNLFAAQWPEVTKPTDGASAVWMKKRTGRKCVDDDDIGTKQVTKGQKLTYCQLNTQKQISVKFE